jgi:hypothetical protein
LIHVGPDVIHLNPLVLYVGPDQILPISSALAAITGILLLFWQRVKLLFQKLAQLFSGRRVKAGPGPKDG